MKILHSHRHQILIKSLFPLQAEKSNFLWLLPGAQHNALLVHKHFVHIHRLKLDVQILFTAKANEKSLYLLWLAIILSSRLTMFSENTQLQFLVPLLHSCLDSFPQRKMYDMLQIFSLRIKKISMLQLPFHVYPTTQSSGCSFALWNSTARNSSCRHKCQAGYFQ